MRLGGRLAALLALALPGAAAAAGAWTVGPTAGGLRIVVTDRADTVCYSLRRGREEDERICNSAAPPKKLAAPFLNPLAGVAGSGVAAVDLEWPDQQRLRIATDGAAYQGRLAGRVRFWLADPPERAQPWLLRRFAADGALIGADRIGDEPVVVPRKTLARGRGWRFFVETRRLLDATVDERDREVVQREIGLTQGGFSSRSWQYPELQHAIDGRVRRLGHLRRLLYGARGPGVAGVDVLLGSGRRVRAHLDGEVFWLRVPPREAVVAVEARDEGGGLLARTEAGVPPAAVPSVTDGDQLLTPLPAPDAPVLSFGGGLAALQEVGPWVCLRIARWMATDDQFPCAYAPMTPGDQRMIAGPRGDRVVLAGLVHHVIAKVRLTSLLTGRTRVVSTSPAPGRWAPYANVFAVSTRSDIGTVELLDAHGRRRGPDWAAPVYATEDQQPLPRVLSGPVGADRYCAELGELQACNPINVLASCRVRRLLVTVSVRGHRALRVITSDGRAHHPKRARGRWIYLAPRRLGVRAVRWSTGQRRLGPVPPVTRQCGYTAIRN